MNVVEFNVPCKVFNFCQCGKISLLASILSPRGEFAHPATWADMAAIVSFLAPIVGEGLGFFAYTAHAYGVLHTYQVIVRFRAANSLFRRNEEVITGGEPSGCSSLLSLVSRLSIGAIRRSPAPSPRTRPVLVHASHFADAFVARANRLTALKALQDHFSSIGGMTRNTLQPKTESRMVNNGFKMLKKQNPA